jgi:hypothetical protein
MAEGQREDRLALYGRTFTSRLMLGTARYASPSVLADAIRAATPAMLTLSLRRQVSGSSHSGQSFWDLVQETGRTILPNTAGCCTANEAVNTACMARDLFQTEYFGRVIRSGFLAIAPGEPIYKSSLRVALHAARVIVDFLGILIAGKFTQRNEVGLFQEVRFFVVRPLHFIEVLFGEEPGIGEKSLINSTELVDPRLRARSSRIIRTTPSIHFAYLAGGGSIRRRRRTIRQRLGQLY